MKARLLLAFAASAAALASAADNPSVGGKWQVHSSISGYENDQVCTFVQKDDGLTGTCVSDQGTVEISGKIDGNKVAWSYKSEYNGSPLTVKFEGAVDPQAGIKGSVEVPEFGVGGDFTATQAK